MRCNPMANIQILNYQMHIPYAITKCVYLM